MDFRNIDFDFQYLLRKTSYVEDDCVNVFHCILNRYTSSQPRPMDFLRSIGDIQPVERHLNHIQLLYCGEDFRQVGHWVCLFYNGDSLRIYDSLKGKSLPQLQQTFVDALFPYKPNTSFPEVQKQSDCFDCGVFAIAFATSLALRKNPCFENFNFKEMRPHMLHILYTGNLVPFPSTFRKPRGNPKRNIFVVENKAFNVKIKRTDAERKIDSRNKPEIKLKEKESDRVRKQAERSVSKKRLARSQLQNTQTHRASRLDPEYRKTEQSRNTEAHRVSRLEPNYRETEQSRNTELHRVSRLEPNYCEAEQSRNTESRRVSRLEPNYRKAEQSRNTEAHRVSRLAFEYREAEQSRNTEAHRVTRLEPEYRKEEQSRNTEAHRVSRLAPEYREAEQSRNTQAHRVAREDEHYRSSEQNIAKHRKERVMSNWESVCEKYKSEIQEGHSNPCHCCGRLWHINSIKFISKSALRLKGIQYSDDYLMRIFHLHPNVETGIFCNTCAKYISFCKVPRLARANGLIFPQIPDVLKDLTSLEERLVCARHIFIKIIKRGSGLGYQHGLAGNVINVPVEVNTMVTSLPRSMSDTHVITVELKRKICYKHGRKERIRPKKIYQAAQYLVQSDLYKELNIQLDENWSYSDDENQHVCTCHEVDNENIEIIDDNDINPGGNETLLDQEMTLVIAPGEGKRPLSLVFDEHMEELGFIKIHCGQKRLFKVKLSHMEITKSEISREDRRAVRPDYLFTALKKQQTIRIQTSIAMCLRKKKRNGEPILVENMLDSAYINNLIHVDDGYRVLRGIKNSPAHWEGEKKKLLAMVRQFGVPTLFITLSAAETKWLQLVKLLKKTVDGVEITEDQGNQLSFAEKARLIQSDPYICATYFDTRFRSLRKTWCSPSGPFGQFKINHFYYRIEFQHRGSPHAHTMLWLKEAPVFTPGDMSSIPRVTNFIDNIITCCSENVESSLIELQRHKHTHTCHPKPGRPCRFGIPFFPSDKTLILTELSEDEPLYEKNKQLGKDLKEKINSLPENIADFEHFLHYVGLTKEQYILVIRACISRPTIILKRNPKDIYINPYSKKILELHCANMDIQYILDPFACSLYIVNYINKADRGMSKLLREVVEENRKDNKAVRESLRAISNVFLNASEISAQEAVYYLLSLHLSHASVAEVFLNTNIPEKRVQMLKSTLELQRMDPKSSDIFIPNLIDHYVNRPCTEQFNAMTLAFFGAYYVFSKKGNKRSRVTEDSNNENEDCEIENEHEFEKCEARGNWIRLSNDSGFIKRRRTPRVIRFCRFSRVLDEDQFYREQLMLYLPWRNEEEELLQNSVNIATKFHSEVEAIKSNSAIFNQLGGAEEFETLLEAIRKVQVEREYNEEETVDHGKEKPLQSYEYEDQFADVADDILPGGNIRPNQGEPSTFIVPVLIPQEQYLELSQKLNVDQRDFLTHVLHHFGNSQHPGWKPLYVFLSGGAGVGKSLLITTIFQCLSRSFNSSPGANPDDTKILLTAPTGKAAFGIGGQTLHSAFSLPVTQVGHSMPQLSASTCNTLACKLAHLKLIVIDEISMVGSKIFYQINRRLQQIFQTTSLFGGISIIAVGDMRQLPPVGDNWIFQKLTGKSIASLAGDTLWNSFQLYELKTIMRQKDDLSFATALNNLAAGTMTSEDLELMSKRCFKAKNLPSNAKDAVFLYSSNALVGAHNEKILNAMTTAGAIVNALDEVFGEPNEAAKHRALNTISSLPTSQTYGLPRTLNLKVSARYMVTINVDTEDGLVNGTTGRLRAIDYGINKLSGERRPLRLWLELDELNAGKNKRRSFCNQYKERLEKNWTPLESAGYIIKKWKASNLQVRRTQFPLVPAEAITVHKSQGATMEKVVIHINAQFKRSMLYVACSRARTSEGLFIINAKGMGFPNPSPPSETSPVVMEMCRLRESPLVPIYRFLHLDRPFDIFQLVYHNVQSLRKHINDVKVDPIVKNSDIVFLAETWCSSSDKFEIDNFVIASEIHGPNLSNANRGMGMIAYINKNVKSITSKKFQTSCGKGHSEVIALDFKGVRLMSIYRSPRCDLSSFLDALNKAIFADSRTLPLAPTIICGDFNIDLITQENTSSLEKYFQKIGLKSALKQVATTINCTQIDNIFSNIEINAGTYWALFSYHKPLWVQFKV